MYLCNLGLGKCEKISVSIATNFLQYNVEAGEDATDGTPNNVSRASAVDGLQHCDHRTHRTDVRLKFTDNVVWNI